MAMSATNLGTYTKRLALTGTNTNADFLTALKNAITGVSPAGTTGWGLHDEINNGMRTTLVFSSLNEDGVTYKNIIVRVNLFSAEISLSTCESWNATTHIATNEAICFGNHSPIPYKLCGTDLLIFISPHYCAMMSVINNEISMWSGVFEMQREDANDTAAENYPCWGYISSALWMLGAVTYDLRPMNSNYHTAICLPKTRNGNTGFNAAVNWAMDFGLMSVPSLWNTGVGSIGYFLSAGHSLLSRTQWSTDLLVLPIKPIHIPDPNNVSNYGKIFGMKVVRNILDAKPLDKVPLKIDAEGDFSPTGTTNDHWVLPIHHARYDGASMTAAFRARDILIAGETVFGLTSTGDFVYVITSISHLCKISTISGAVTQYSSIGHGTWRSIVYDGERYIYIGTSFGLIRVDTQNSDAVTLLIISNGAAAISVNQNHILTAPWNPSATPVISRIDKNTFAPDATLPTVTLATFTESVVIRDIVCDGYGHFYLIANVVTATNNKLVKITQAGVASYLATGINNISLHSGLTIIDEKTLQVNQLQTTTNLRVTYVSITSGTEVTLGTSFTITVGSSYTAELPLKTVKVNGLFYTLLRGSGLYGVIGRIGNGTDLPNLWATYTNTGLTTSPGACFYTHDNRLYLPIPGGLRIYEGINEEIYSGTTNLRCTEALLPS